MTDWDYKTKHTASYTNSTKHLADYSNSIKNIADYDFLVKSELSWEQMDMTWEEVNFDWEDWIMKLKNTPTYSYKFKS